MSDENISKSEHLDEEFGHADTFDECSAYLGLIPIRAATNDHFHY